MDRAHARKHTFAHEGQLAAEDLGVEDVSAWHEFQCNKLRATTERAPLLMLAAPALSGFVRVSLGGGDVWDILRAWPIWTALMCIWIVQSRSGISRSRMNATDEHLCIVAYNIVYALGGFALCLVLSSDRSSELLCHRTFLITFAVQMFFCHEFYYLPKGWHVYAVTIPATCCWMWFHWRLAFLGPVPTFWGIILPLLELMQARAVERHGWQLFQAMRNEEQARMRIESVEAALQGMLSSVFDASCECDGHGMVLSASPHLQQLIGGGPVGAKLADLALTPEESLRITALLQQSLADSAAVKSRCCASKIETSLCHQTLTCGEDGFELHVMLSCTAMPLHGANLCSSRFVLGFQQIQPVPVTSGPDLEDLEEAGDEFMPLLECAALGSKDVVFSLSSTLSDCGAYESQSLLSFASRATDFCGKDDETRSLGSLTCSVTQPAASRTGSSGVRIRGTADSATQTEALAYSWAKVISQPAQDASTQTAATACRPPLQPSITSSDDPPVKRKRNRRASLHGGSLSIKHFKETHQSTVKVLVRNILDRFNPRGRACCPYHLALAVVSKAVSKLGETGCSEARFLPCMGWQCKVCLALNDDLSDDEEQESCEVCLRPRLLQGDTGSADEQQSDPTPDGCVQHYEASVSESPTP